MPSQLYQMENSQVISDTNREKDIAIFTDVKSVESTLMGKNSAELGDLRAVGLPDYFEIQKACNTMNAIHMEMKRLTNWQRMMEVCLSLM